MRVLVNDSLDSLDLNAALTLLPPFRREKALRYTRDIDRRESVAAWLLLRKACREELGLEEVPEVAWTETGKPYFPSLEEVHFNLSHCPEAAVCVIDTKPVGIDVESVRPIDEDLIARVMNDREQDQILSAPDPELAFLRLWTRKESLLKLTGQGLCEPLDTLLEEHSDVHFNTVTAPSGHYVYTLASFF